MRICIETIPDSQHRFPFTGADWFYDSHGDLQVRVSKLSDWRRETILAVHELVEAILCRHNGVSQKAVDDFDTEYDRTHLHDLNSGDDPLAPYHHEHCLATAVERIMAAELRVQWSEYDLELESFPSRQEMKP